MKALVSGGCGFIGSHLVARLVQDDHDVVIIDNLSNGRVQNIENYLQSGSVQLVEGNICDSSVVETAMQGRTHVFHLAALADIVPSIEEPLDYYTANVQGTSILVEAARKCRIQKFLYAASSSCYGTPDAFPTPESAPMRPQYPYALTKWLGEEIIRHWGEVYGLPYVSLRLFNVYGPRSRTSGTYGAVFGVFLAQKLAGQPMTIVGDGTQSRDFTFVTDVAHAFMKAAESEVRQGVYNVGSGESQTVNSLAALIGGPTIQVPKRPGEPDVTLADCRKIERDLGWTAQVPLSEGVREMLRNIEFWRDAPVWDPESIKQATKVWFDHLGESQNE